MLVPFPKNNEIEERRLGNSYTVGLIDALIEESKNLDITIFANKYKEEKKQKYQNVKIKRIWRRGRLNPFFLLQETIKLNPDLVHIQYVLGAKYGKNLYFFNPFIFMLFLRIVRYPLVLTIHDVIPSYELSNTFKKMFKKYQRISFLYSLGYRFITMFMGKIASKIIILDQGTKKWTIDQYGYSENKITIIPHGMYENTGIISFTQEKKALKAFENWNCILFFGKIHPRKGIEILIKALPYVLQNHPKTKLLIAGDYSGSWKGESKLYLNSLKKLTKSLGVESYTSFEIKFFGKEIPIFFETADIIVLPYILPFGASGVIKLAATYKKPVITSNSLSRKGEIDNGISGYLIPSVDETFLAQKINKLLDDKSLALVMGERFYKENYISSDWNKVAKKTLECYKTI